ncbi:MAG: MmgE/PrpD family protein [Chloroflexi bacterium]|nr:MmgE/PrpD family protein [Chloroflexota bacterium]
MDQRIEKMITYAQGLTYEDLPPEVVGRAKHLILDTIGCALGAAPGAPGRIVRAAAAKVTSATPATVMVSGSKTSPDMAAFANGVMARYLDWNDGYFGAHGGGHPSDMLAPTLAAVETTHGGGKEAILGFVLGYEAQCGMADAGGMDAKIGSNQTLDGAVGAVVLASRTLGLDKEQMRHAINLAMAACRPMGRQSRGQLSHWKEAHVPNSSRNGVFFAMMAAEGLTGPEFDFEEPTQWLPFGGDGRSFRIMESGVKRFPAGYFSQSAIEAMQELRPKVRNLADIKDKIKIRIGEENISVWPEPLNNVDMEMNSGEVLNARVSYHLGHFKRLMSDADQERKFRPMAEEYAKLPKAQVDRLLDRLRHLEQVRDIGEVLALTVPPKR